MIFPPRNETNDFNTQLENLYRDRLGASPISAYVDLEGANVWLTEYARYRVGLCPHADAMTRVFSQINAGVVTACARSRRSERSPSRRATRVSTS